MSAELQQLMDQVVPKDVNTWDLAKQTQQIRKEARKLNATHKQQKLVSIVTGRAFLIFLC